MTECRTSGWTGHKMCKFEARYDQEPSNAAGIKNFKGATDELTKTVLTKKTYVKDVCIHCGKEIQR